MKKTYTLVEYEMTPTKVLMENATIDEIASKLGYVRNSCYPIGSMIGGKYKILREGEKVKNPNLEYFVGACYIIAKMARKGKGVTKGDIDKVMDAVIRGVNRA